MDSVNITFSSSSVIGESIAGSWAEQNFHFSTYLCIGVPGYLTWPNAVCTFNFQKVVFKLNQSCRSLLICGGLSRYCKTSTTAFCFSLDRACYIPYILTYSGSFDILHPSSLTSTLCDKYKLHNHQPKLHATPAMHSESLLLCLRVQEVVPWSSDPKRGPFRQS